MTRLPSMRARLTLALSLLAVALIVILALAVYALTRREMIRQLDHSLEDKVRFLRAFCRQNDGLIGFAMSKVYWERIRDRDDPEFFEYRFQNGTVIKRSASLGSTELPLLGLGGDVLEYADVALPGGRRGRCAGLSFYPDEVSGAAPAKQISLVVAHDGAHIWHALAEVRKLIIAVGCATLLVIAIVTGWIIRAGMRPLADLGGQIDAIPVGETGGRIHLSRPSTEIEPVVNRLNLLMARVENAIHNERQFTSNAAHELRNPLAGILAQLELALGDDSLPPDSRKPVELAAGIAASLQQTTANLLQLARLEAGTEKIETALLDIARFLRTAWKPFFDRAEAKDLTVRWKLSEGIGAFATSPELLRVAATNLFDNAVEYTPSGGSIDISAALDARDALEISIANTTSMLDAEEIPRMFERFWRTADTGVVSQGHSGIGLSLSRKIAEALGGTLAASPDGSARLRITIYIPLRKDPLP